MNEPIDILHWLVIVLFALCILGAVIQDCRSLLISNYFSIFLVLLFVPASLVADLSTSDIALHFLISFAVLVIATPLFIYGIMGGGDVKLLAATSLWFDWVDLGSYLVLIAVLGGVLALTILIMRRLSKSGTDKPALPWLSDQEGLPYGVAIGIAALALMPKISVLPSSY